MPRAKRPTADTAAVADAPAPADTAPTPKEATGKKAAPQDSIAAGLAFLEKKIDKRAFEGREELEAVSSGCLAVDYITGIGGFPRGRISEVFGLESSGKSTLCMSACAKAQALGLTAVYVDLERSLIRDHAAKLGFDVTKRGVWVQPDTFEETLQIIDAMAKAGVDLILIDSVPALVPESVMKEAITEMNMFAAAARIFSATLPRLIKTIEQTNTALVLVNQLRANIVTDPWAAKFAPKEKSYGGFALRYYTSMRISLRQEKKNERVRKMPSVTDPGKEIEVPVASLHTATTYKSKVGQPYQTVQFLIRYDPVADVWGIDNLQTRIDVARTKGIITEKSGGYFTFPTATGGVQTARGLTELYDWYQQRPDEIAALKEKAGI